jgi:hypothetical protein
MGFFELSTLKEAYTLKGVWDFIRPLLSDKLKEKLKEKSSAEKARERAFNLYMSLGKVAVLKNRMHIILQDYLLAGVELVVDEDKGIKSDIVDDDGSTVIVTYEKLDRFAEISMDKLQSLLWEFRDALDDLSTALEAVEPQLEIHKHDLVERINAMMGGPALMMDNVHQLLRIDDALEDENEIRQNVTDLLAQLEINYKLINESIEDFRSFLAQEFSFKESF